MDAETIHTSKSDEDFKRAILADIECRKRFRESLERAARAFIGKNCAECRLPVGYNLNIPDFSFEDVIEFIKFMEDKELRRSTL